MKNKFIIGSFILMLAVFVFILAMPADKASLEAENRTMTEIPKPDAKTVFSGEFAQGFESHISDSIGFRSFFTSLSRNMEASKGFSPKTGRIISTNKDIGTGTTQKQTLIAADQSVMEMFVKNRKQEALYAEAVNHYAEKLPENVKLYSMIIPTRLSFCEPIYKNLQDDQGKAIERIYEHLDSSVGTVDAYGALSEHSKEYIYFRTDHHWTQRGAYYAYRAFMEENGGESVEIDSFEKNVGNSFLGYLYNRVTDSHVDILPDKLEWFDIDPQGNIKTSMRAVDEYGEVLNYSGTMYDSKKQNYQFFFGSDHPIVEMTNSENYGGKTLVVLKDSYTNALATWLIKSYHKVILVDPRIFENNFQYILDTYPPDEVLIANYIFTTNFADYCELLKNLY